MTYSAHPQLSIIVCTYNRYDMLPNAITSLLGQQVAPDSLEIIVVDNSPDQTAALNFSTRLAYEPRIRYFIEPTPGLSNARNVGVGHSRSNLVAFLDDDAIAAPDWA